MYIKFIKNHPAGFVEGQITETEESHANKMIADGFCKAITQEEFDEWKNEVEEKNKKEQAILDERIRNSEKTAAEEMAILREIVIAEIKEEEDAKAKAKADFEAKLRKEEQERIDAINEQARKDKEVADANRLADLKASIKNSLLIEKANGVDIFTKYSPIIETESKSKSKSK